MRDQVVATLSSREPGGHRSTLILNTSIIEEFFNFNMISLFFSFSNNIVCDWIGLIRSVSENREMERGAWWYYKISCVERAHILLYLYESDMKLLIK